jgi:hypothetical protein
MARELLEAIRFAGCSREFRYSRGAMQFNEQSKPAYAKIIRTKLKKQMGEHADRIDLFSDDKIIEMHEKWRERSREKFRAIFEEWRSEHPDSCGEIKGTPGNWSG